MAKKRNWDLVKAEYVEGIQDKEGKITFPTLEDLAKKHKCSFSYIQKVAAAGEWTEARQIYRRKLEDARQAKKTEILASAAAQFDADVLKVVKMELVQVQAHLVQAMRELQRDKNSTMDPETLERMTRALYRIQKVGRLALGESTDKVEGDIDAEGDDEFLRLLQNPAVLSAIQSAASAPKKANGGGTTG